MPGVPGSRSSEWRKCPLVPLLLALLHLCGCVTGMPPGGARQEEAERGGDSEAEALEEAVAAVHSEAWEVARSQHRVGTRLLLRLRVEERRRMVSREWEVQRGTGQEGVPVEEERFRRMLGAALRRQAWGRSGDVVVVLRREEAGWREEDSVHEPSAHGVRPPEPARTRYGVSSSATRGPAAPMSTRPAIPPSPRAREHEERAREEEAERRRAVEEKLEEYLRWGMRLMETHARRSRPIAPGHRLREHPLREKSLEALVNATLAWAQAHTDDPEFLRRSPSEVALYLLASRSALATAIELGKRAPPRLDYTPPPEEVYTPEELLLELAIGFTPGVGEMADVGAFLLGYSVTGHRLDETERVLSLLAVLVPLANGKLLKEGGEAALERVALITGQSLNEVRVLSRVAAHLGPGDVREIERLLREASAGRAFTPEELEYLNRVARGLETPVREAAESLSRGEKLPLLGARTLQDGARLLPGTPAHLAQCWVDYQFRHPGKYRRFSYAVDPEWERLYRTILANKPAGNAFEEAILTVHGYTKNTAVMVPPPGTKAQGFIPDSVPGNPHPSELVWGRPYSFVEAKARNELALTGNLEAMLDYVRHHGGHIELWIRSATHPSGETKLTGPLQKTLERLKSEGKVTVRHHPP